MRKEARISTSVWRSDFTELPLACQGLYWMLLSQPDISMCGVLPYLPSRWEQMCGSEDITRALGMLEDAGYLIVDRQTSEVLIRTFVKHDGVLRSPKTRAGMWRAWDSVLSTPIRAVVLGMVTDHVEEAVKEDWIDHSEVTKVTRNTLSDTPSMVGLDTPSDGASPRARASTTSPTTTTDTSTSLVADATRQPDLLFEAVAQVCGLNWRNGITDSERGRLNKAVKELRDVGANPDVVKAKAHAYRHKWPEAELTPTALASNWGQLEARGGAVSIETCPICGQAKSSHDQDVCDMVKAAS